jgi:hypothetical protein
MNTEQQKKTVMSSYTVKVKAAKLACDNVHGAEKQLASYRLEAGKAVRAAYKAGAAEGKTKAEVAQDIGYSISWCRELAAADTPKKVEKAKAKKTAAVKKHRNQSPLRNGGQADDADAEAEWMDDDKPSNHDRDIKEDIKEAEFLLQVNEARRLAHYAGPVNADILTACRSVAAAWSKLGDHVEAKLKPASKVEKVKVTLKGDKNVDCETWGRRAKEQLAKALHGAPAAA